MAPLSKSAFLFAVIISLPLASCGNPKTASISPEIDAGAVATLVKNGTITFDPNHSVTVTMASGSYTIETVKAAPGQRYLALDQLKLTAGPPSFPNPPPLPPRPMPPIPGPDHGGPPPTKPPTPGTPPPTGFPKPPKPPPRSLIEQYADAGAVVGRLKTDGVSYPGGTLAKGTYTILLSSYAGAPVALLIDSDGHYVASSTNFFLVDTPPTN